MSHKLNREDQEVFKSVKDHLATIKDYGGVLCSYHACLDQS